MTLTQSPTKNLVQNLDTSSNLVTPTNQKMAENINTTSENTTLTTTSGQTTERSTSEEPTTTCMTPSVTPSDSRNFSGQQTDRSMEPLSSSTDGIEVITETENEMMDDSKHKLHDKWSFWYMDTSEKGKGKNKKSKYDKKKNQPTTPVTEKNQPETPMTKQESEKISESDSGIQFSVDKIVQETTKEMNGNLVPEPLKKTEPDAETKNREIKTQDQNNPVTEKLTEDEKNSANTGMSHQNNSTNPIQVEFLATTNTAPTIPNNHASKKNFTDAWSKQLVNQGPLVTLNSVEDFFNLHVNCMQPSKLGSRHDYMFFRDGIVPDWDDFRNKEGGKWVIILPNSYREEKLDMFWFRICESLVAEMYLGFGTKVNGATLQRRQKEDKISLWTDNKDEAANEKVGRKLIEILGICSKSIIAFREHEQSPDGNTSIGYDRDAKTKGQLDDEAKILFKLGKGPAYVPIRKEV